jgi:hypothetical protein
MTKVINTKSSTEAELVGVNDVMPQILWTHHFLEAQGYGVSDSIIYQDKQSAVLMEKNGRASQWEYIPDTSTSAISSLRIEWHPTK